MNDRVSFDERLAATEGVLLRGLRGGPMTLDQVADPAAELRAEGYDIPAGSEAEFNAMFATVIAPDIGAARLAAERNLDTWPSLKCSACTVVCWGVAVAIVAVGAAAVASLSTTSPVVVSLAATVGVTAKAALAFIATLTTAISRGAAAVVGAICIWAGTCTAADLR